MSEETYLTLNNLSRFAPGMYSKVYSQAKSYADKKDAFTLRGIRVSEANTFISTSLFTEQLKARFEAKGYTPSETTADPQDLQFDLERVDTEDCIGTILSMMDWLFDENRDPDMKFPCLSICYYQGIMLALALPNLIGENLVFNVITYLPFSQTFTESNALLVKIVNSDGQLALGEEEQYEPQEWGLTISEVQEMEESEEKAVLLLIDSLCEEIETYTPTLFISGMISAQPTFTLSDGNPDITPPHFGDYLGFIYNVDNPDFPPFCHISYYCKELMVISTKEIPLIGEEGKKTWIGVKLTDSFSFLLVGNYESTNNNGNTIETKGIYVGSLESIAGASYLPNVFGLTSTDVERFYNGFLNVRVQVSTPALIDALGLEDLHNLGIVKPPESFFFDLSAAEIYDIPALGSLESASILTLDTSNILKSVTGYMQALHQIMPLLSIALAMETEGQVPRYAVDATVLNWRVNDNNAIEDTDGAGSGNNKIRVLFYLTDDYVVPVGPWLFSRIMGASGNGSDVQNAFLSLFSGVEDYEFPEEFLTYHGFSSKAELLSYLQGLGLLSNSGSSEPEPEPDTDVSVTVYDSGGNASTVSMNPNLTYAGNAYQNYYTQGTYLSSEDPNVYLANDLYPAEGDAIYETIVLYSPVTVTVHEDGYDHTVTLDSNKTYGEQGYEGYYTASEGAADVGYAPYSADSVNPSEGDEIWWHIELIDPEHGTDEPEPDDYSGAYMAGQQAGATDLIYGETQNPYPYEAGDGETEWDYWRDGYESGWSVNPNNPDVEV